MSAAPARWRGLAAGLLTAALALAAHSVGGDGIPAGTTAVLVVAVATIIGALGRSMPRTAGVGGMACLLALGQVCSHGVMAAGGHDHPMAGAMPVVAMTAAHVASTVAGAILISIGDRLCHTLSTVLRTTSPVRLSVASSSRCAVSSADQPLQSARLLACSVSHRGPPVCFAS